MCTPEEIRTEYTGPLKLELQKVVSCHILLETGFGATFPVFTSSVVRCHWQPNVLPLDVLMAQFIFSDRDLLLFCGFKVYRF